MALARENVRELVQAHMATIKVHRRSKTNPAVVLAAGVRVCTAAKVPRTEPFADAAAEKEPAHLGVLQVRGPVGRVDDAAGALVHE
jgi:hypothetical protein